MKNILSFVKPTGYAKRSSPSGNKPIGFRRCFTNAWLRSVPARFTKNKGKTMKNRNAGLYRFLPCCE